LRRIRTELLMQECPEMRFVSNIWPTVYLLREAETGDIHAVAGLGPVRRGKIRDYLASRNVIVKWQV